MNFPVSEAATRSAANTAPTMSRKKSKQITSRVRITYAGKGLSLEWERSPKNERSKLGRGSPFQVGDGKRREGEAEGEGAALAGVVGGGLAADVADVGATVVGSVGVENFFVEAGAGDTDDVAFADHGSGVHDDYDEVVFSFTFAQEGKHAVIAVVAIDPFETLPVEIDFVESGFGGEKVIEIGDQFLNAAM